MKLNEVKTYVLGVLRGAFKNKNLLDNLSLSDNNKVCYDNHPINSMDRCYRYETTLWEGNMTSTATVNLPFSFDFEIVISLFSFLNANSYIP